MNREEGYWWVINRQGEFEIANWTGSFWYDNMGYVRRDDHFKEILIFIPWPE